MEIKDILKQEGILEFKEDIRRMSKRKLLQHFSAASSGQAKASYKKIVKEALKQFKGSSKDTNLALKSLK